jgi:hypothetical protein
MVAGSRSWNFEGRTIAAGGSRGNEEVHEEVHGEVHEEVHGEVQLGEPSAKAKAHEMREKEWPTASPTWIMGTMPWRTSPDRFHAVDVPDFFRGEFARRARSRLVCPWVRVAVERGWLAWALAFFGDAGAARAATAERSAETMQVARDDSPGGAFYVSTEGADGNPGTMEQPWRSFAHAAGSVSAGDVVYVRGGTYAQRLVVTGAVSEDAPLEFRAYPGEQPVLDGSSMSLEENQGMIHVERSKGVVIAGFGIERSSGAGIYVNLCSNVTLAANTTSNTVSSGIGVWRSRYAWISSNVVELACNDGEQECITVALTEDFDVGHNVVRNGGPGTHGGEGIDAKHGSRNGTIHHNRVHDLSRLGIYVDAWNLPTGEIDVYANVVHGCSAGYAVAAENGGLLQNVRLYNNLAFSNRYGIVVADWGEDAPHPMSDVFIYHNTVADNAGASWGGGILIENTSCTNVVVQNNLCSQNQSFQIAVGADVPRSRLSISRNFVDGYRGYDPTEETRGSNYVEGTAAFVDRLAEDFRLKPTSAAIDQAVAWPGLTNDFFGNPRPIGAAADLGACESTATELFRLRAVALTNSVVLRWTDPMVCGLNSRTVLLRFAQGSYPTGVSDGTGIYEGSDTQFHHRGLVPGTSYYYAIFTSDDGKTFAPPP